MSRLVAFICLVAFGVVIVGSSSVHAMAVDSADIDPRLMGYPEVTISVDAEGIEVPATITAGRNLVIQENLTKDAPEAMHFFLLRVPDEVSGADLAASDFSDVTKLPEWAYSGTMIGNPDRAATNSGKVYGLVDFVEGRYIVMYPSFEHPLVSRFDVVPSASPVANPAVAPVADVTATNFEMDFTIIGPVPAGRQIWEITNTGVLLHEMAITPVPAGATDADVIAAFGAVIAGKTIDTAGLGVEWAEWGGDLVNGSGAMSGGQTTWVQFDLPPGTYAAVCFVPGAEFTPHLMDGMVQVFTVSK